MANPTIPVDGLGTIDWTNNIHNWREEDAEFLQSRSVIREETFGDSSSPSHEEQGSVSYQTSDDTLGVYNGTAWMNVPAARYIQTYGDTSTAVTLTHTSATAGIQLHHNGTVVLGNTTVPQLTATTKITLGTVPMTVSGSTVTVTGNITATNLTSTTSSIGTSTAASLTASGTVQGATLQATGSSSLAVATATSLTLGSTVLNSTSVTANSVGSSGDVALVGDELTDGTNYIDVAAWEGNTGATNPATIATVITGSGPYDAEDYPDGCIWIQT